jgi:hypothetical protein
MLTLFSILACSSKHPNPNASVVLDDETTIEQSELNGTLVTDTIPAPEFVVLNHDGSERTRDNLMGKPTVVWFYPAANTPG